jgi:hypothetical protein
MRLRVERMHADWISLRDIKSHLERINGQCSSASGRQSVHSLQEARAQRGETSCRRCPKRMGIAAIEFQKEKSNRSRVPKTNQLDSPESDRNQKSNLYNDDVELMWIFLDAATN